MQTSADSGAAPAAPVPNGVDTAPPPASPQPQAPAREYTVTDTRSAGEAIAGLLFGADDDLPPPASPEPKPDGDTPSDGEQPPDPGVEETPPTEGDDQGQGEQPKPAAIEPPASWSSDEKQQFSQLPPAVQQTIARRESQREAALTQRSQEAAESRRAFEQERNAAVGLRNEYLQGLQQMLMLAAPEAQQLANVDWMAVQAQSPAEYTRLQALRDSMQQRVGSIQAAMQQQQQELSQYQQQQLLQHVERERAILYEKLPEFADEVKGPALRQELGLYLRDVGGFKQEEISQAYDNRLVVMGVKAMLYDRMMNARASADQKRNNVPAEVQRPGASQAQNDRGPQQALRERVNRFGRSNSVRDAGSLIAEIL